jgi:hypothetical protein
VGVASSTVRQSPVGIGWAATLVGFAAVGLAGLLPPVAAVPLGLVGVAAGIATLVVARTRQGAGSGHGVVALVLGAAALALSTGLALTTATARSEVPGPWAGPDPSTPSKQRVVRLQAVTISASATAPPSIDAGNNVVTFDASKAVDGDPATAWRTAGGGVGDTLRVSFARSVHLVGMGMIVGYDKVDTYDGTDRFQQNGRVSRARVTIDDGRNADLTFADSRDLQPVSLEADTASVTVTILSSVPGSRDYTAISEIEFYGTEG